MSWPLVNVIIITYDQYHYTEKCVRSLFDCNYDNLKIFLIDNGSKKQNYREFYNNHKDNSKLEFIRSEKNLGFGGGCNLALNKIKDGYIAILNNDIEVEKNWLQPIVEYMEKHPEVGACQPKIKDINRKEYFEYAGAAGGFMDVFGYPFSRGRIFYTLEKDEGQYDNITDLVWCSGTAFVTKKEVIDKVGLFDEIFFMYGEESDLCWRMNHCGYRLVFIPGSVIYHQGMGTMKKNKSSKKIFYLHRNGLILLIKNYSGWELIKYLPVRMCLDFICFFYYLFQCPLYFNWWALVKAYLNIFWWLPKIVKRHHGVSRIKRKHISGLKYPLYHGSAVINYFLRNKKLFSKF